VGGEEDGEGEAPPAATEVAPRAGADNRARLEKFITAIADGSETVAGTLILRISSLPSNQRLYKAVQKAGEVVKCDPPKKAELPAWVLKRCKSVHRVEIEPAAANQLAELVGDDLGRLDSELSKLAIQCDGGKITAKDVAGSVSFQREQEIWEITTLLGRGVTKQAVERYRQIVQADPSAQYRMITWLGILLENYRTLLIAKDRNLNLSGVAKSLRIFDDRVLREYLTAAGKLGRAGVTERLARLTDLDRRIKTGLAEAAEGIERYIATLHA
jgi:DNA polymerase-3 subunit delta